MVSTTRLHKPNKFIINNGTKDLEYEIARNRNKERLWRQSKVRVQPGQGELVKHWDSWHSGMGWSRDESRDAQYAPPVYEVGNLTTGGIIATHRGFLYPGLEYTQIGQITSVGDTLERITEMGDYIYAFGTSGTDIRVIKVDPSDDSVVYGRTFSGWTAPPGQPAEFGGYLYVPSGGAEFKELTTICDDLTAAFFYNGSTYTDNTANANADGGSAFTLLGDNSDDYFYWGADTKFDGLYIDLVIPANTALTLDWEYWNGAAWTDIVGPETDGTSGFTVDGWVTWASASQTGWATTTVNSVTAYFVRVNTSTAATTWPTSDWTPPSDVWTDGPSTRKAWHMGTAGKLLWRVGDSAATPSHHVINSCSDASSGGSGGPLTAGNWSDTADYVIGKPGRNINSLAEMGRWLYVGKEEGMFGSDSSGNQTNALDFVRNLIASTNCNDTIRWLGTLVTTHKTGLWQHTGASSRPIGIETLESNLSSVKGGRYTALATAGEWLYAAYLLPGGAQTAILAGRPGHEDESSVVWHHIWTFTGTVEAMHISAQTTNPKLALTAWYAGSAAGVTTISLAQDGSPDPTDSNITFHAGAANCDLPAVDWGMPGTPKQGHMVEIVTSQAIGTGGTVKVYYGWDGATPSTQLGSNITTATKTQCFWAGGNTEGTHWGYRPQVRVQPTGHATNVLRVDKVSLYCIARPRMEDGIETTIRIADSLDGSRTAKTAYDDLNALVNAGVYSVRDPDDPAGGTFYAIVHNIAPSKGEQLGDQSGAEFVTVTLRKVAYS